MTRDEVIKEFFKHQPMLMEFIRYLVHNSSDAQDLFQDVAVVVMKTDPGTVPESSRFGAWCRGVARNVVRHYWRDRKKADLPYTDGLTETLEMAYDEADCDREIWTQRRRVLDLCIGKLPVHALGILRKHYLEGVKIVDMASRMGQTADALRMMLMRIRKTLQDCIRRQATI